MLPLLELTAGGVLLLESRRKCATVHEARAEARDHHAAAVEKIVYAVGDVKNRAHVFVAIVVE